MARLLAYVTGLVNQQLLLQNEYLFAENKILRSHLPVRVPLTNPQRATLAEIAKRMGRRALEQVAGALNNLGHCVSDQTVGNILSRFAIAPAPRRRQQMSWTDFIRSHTAVIAGSDFFTVEVLTRRGLVTYYVLFFLTWRRDGSRSPESPRIRRASPFLSALDSKLW